MHVEQVFLEIFLQYKLNKFLEGRLWGAPIERELTFIPSQT